MNAPPLTRPATLEEFERLPVGPPNYEYEEGEILATASPTPDHQDITREVGSVAFHFVRKNNLGRVFTEVDVYLPDGRVYVPDICFLSAERLDLVSPINRKIYGAPDLCVEVVSQDVARDRVKKFRVYLRNGVLWYWLIDPDTLAIEEYRLTPEGYIRTASIAAGETFQPGVFPGLEINIADILGIAIAPATQEQTVTEQPEANNPQIADSATPEAGTKPSGGAETGP